MNNYNMNDLAHKILQEELYKSYDIVHEHMDALTNMDCNGVTFAQAVFCKAVDDKSPEFFHHFHHWYQNLSHDTLAHINHHLITSNVFSTTDMQKILAYDFFDNPASSDVGEKTHRMLAASAYAYQGQHYDVIQWLVDCATDPLDRVLITIFLHLQDAQLFEKIQFNCDIICLLSHLCDPFTKSLFGQWDEEKLQFLRNDTLGRLDHMIRTSDSEDGGVYSLCKYIYHHHTHLVKLCLENTDGRNIIENAEDDTITELVMLSLSCNNLNACYLLFNKFTASLHDAPAHILELMIVRNIPHFIEHFSSEEAKNHLPMAVAVNNKDIGFLLLQKSPPDSCINWEFVQRSVAAFDEQIAQEHLLWPDRLEQWVNEYEQSLLHFETQKFWDNSCPPTHKKI